jgi:hypothetical protein
MIFFTLIFCRMTVILNHLNDSVKELEKVVGEIQNIVNDREH